MLTVVDDGAALPAPLFRLRIAVRWGDLDADGHVNNTTVLRYVEEARMQWAAKLGLARSDPGLTPVVANLACSYARPIGYPVTLDVRLACMRVGNSSLLLAFSLTDADDPAIVYAQASVTWVWVDAQSKRPHPMPQALREACAQAGLAT